MTKSKNRKRRKASQTCDSKGGGIKPSPKMKKVDNPLLSAQSDFLSKLPTKVKNNFFDESQVNADTRGEIWAEQADTGEKLVNKHSWATPDERALRILEHFAPIVEIGCGSNAYWSKMLNDKGVDVLAFDSQLHEGGKILVSGQNKQSSSRNHYDNTKTIDDFMVHRGGPEVLDEEKWVKDMKKRALFLCYPDEEDFNEDGSNNECETMGAACLKHFRGDIVIHVGELYGDTVSMDQAPWGRSSGAEFQQRLYSEYHCLLKAKLKSWLHVRDTISVWKRTQCCSIVFQDENDNESDDEVEYRHIPENEILPVDAAASCAKHLL